MESSLAWLLSSKEKENNMKTRKTLIYVAMGLMLSILANCTESSKAGNDTDKNNALLLAILNRNTANAQARQACANAVYLMNQCIGSGSGFNPAVMCADANLQAGGTYTDSSVTPAATITYTGTEAYTRLASCVATQIAATNCNFSQNKVASPVQAKAAFFSSCEVDYNSASITAATKATKAPSGTIITIF